MWPVWLMNKNKEIPNLGTALNYQYSSMYAYAKHPTILSYLISQRLFIFYLFIGYKMSKGRTDGRTDEQGWIWKGSPRSPGWTGKLTRCVCVCSGVCSRLIRESGRSRPRLGSTIPSRMGCPGVPGGKKEKNQTRFLVRVCLCVCVCVVLVGCIRAHHHRADDMKTHREAT